MRTVCCFLFSCFLGIASSQVSIDTLRISSQQKFKNIPTCIGVACLAGGCSSDVPAGTVASTLYHDHVTMGKIKQSSMICELPNGICTRMTFVLDDAKTVEQAGKQASKQFGKPVYRKDGSKYVYTWKYATSDNRKLDITLEVAADQKHGMMYITEQV